MTSYKVGDRVIYHDDEAPYVEHAATITAVWPSESCAPGWYEVKADDISGDKPGIHESLILRREGEV